MDEIASCIYKGSDLNEEWSFLRKNENILWSIRQKRAVAISSLV